MAAGITAAAGLYEANPFGPVLILLFLSNVRYHNIVRQIYSDQMA